MLSICTSTAWVKQKSNVLNIFMFKLHNKSLLIIYSPKKQQQNTSVYSVMKIALMSVLSNIYSSSLKLSSIPVSLLTLGMYFTGSVLLPVSDPRFCLVLEAMNSFIAFMISAG